LSKLLRNARSSDSFSANSICVSGVKSSGATSRGSTVVSRRPGRGNHAALAVNLLETVCRPTTGPANAAFRQNLERVPGNVCPAQFVGVFARIRNVERHVAVPITVAASQSRSKSQSR
jgi:hypothetical protein